MQSPSFALPPSAVGLPPNVNVHKLLYSTDAGTVLVHCTIGRSPVGRLFARTRRARKYARVDCIAEDESVGLPILAFDGMSAYFPVTRLEPREQGFLGHFTRLDRVELKPPYRVSSIPASRFRRDIVFGDLIGSTSEGASVLVRLGVRKRAMGKRRAIRYYIANIELATMKVTLQAALSGVFF